MKYISSVALIVFVFATSYIFANDLKSLMGEHGVPDPTGICSLVYAKGGPVCQQAQKCPDFTSHIGMVVRQECQMAPYPTPLIGCRCMPVRELTRG